MAILNPARQVNERRSDPYARRSRNERRQLFFDRRKRAGLSRFLRITVGKFLSLRFAFP